VLSGFLALAGILISAGQSLDALGLLARGLA
jgi:hypothetical protein